MQLCSVLVVDDEPYIANSVTALLQCQSRWNMDVQCFYSGEEALAVLQAVRVDILVTDIRMPGINGLTLVRRARELWPECQMVLLTAYEDFSFAYEALQIGVSTFLLKTESDERLLDEIGHAVALLEERRALPPTPPHRKADADDVNAQLLLGLILNGRDHKPSEEAFRRLNVDAGDLWLITAALCDEDHERAGELEWLIGDSIAERATIIAACRTDEALVLLMRPNTRVSSLQGALELAQEHYAETFGREPSMVVSVVDQRQTSGQPSLGLAAEYSRAAAFLTAVREDMNGFIYLMPPTDAETEPGSGAVFNVMLEYIRTHLNEDLSLNTLSAVIGYSPTYLSRLFHKKTGERISAYIADKKLEQLQAFLLNDELSLDAIVDAMGFSSRSYFNRYVKRLTGYTPKQLRSGAGACSSCVRREREEY